MFYPRYYGLKNYLIEIVILQTDSFQKYNLAASHVE